MYKIHYSISWKCSLLLHILPWYFCEKVYCHTGKFCLGNKTSLKFVILSPLPKVHVGRPRRMFVYSSIVCFLIQSLFIEHVCAFACMHAHAHTHTHQINDPSIFAMLFLQKHFSHIFSTGTLFQSVLHMAFQ